MTDFRPLPLLGNPHVQTLLAVWLRGPEFAFATRQHHLRLPDGDCLVLHDSVPTGWRPGGRIALLVHGLGGSYRAGSVQRLAQLLLPHGLRIVRVDLRGCGRGVGLARRPYNAGCSDDLRAAAAEVRRWSPTSALILAGFSLGGNVVLKLAGEASDRPVPGLERVAAVAPPIDLEQCSDLLTLPRNRIYERHFTQLMIQYARRQLRRFPDLAPVRFPRQLTLRLFDELYTAPRSGYADALDYYRRAAAGPLIPRIRHPALILTARDDPFIAVEPFEKLVVPPHIDIRIVARGGHVGFLGWDGAGGIRWAERRVAEWVRR